jgi:CHAT domain-containing protein/tetratricopeptide (TPR) repeat protein
VHALLLVVALTTPAGGVPTDSLLADVRAHLARGRTREVDSLVTIGLASADSLTRAKLIEYRVLARLGRGEARDPALEEMARLNLALRARLHGPVDPGYARGLAVYGRLLRMAGRSSEARPYLERSVALLDSVHAETGEVFEPAPHQDLAMICGTVGEHERSIALYRRCVADFGTLYGREHPAGLAQRMNMGLEFQQIGAYDSARTAFEEALAGLRRQPDYNPGMRASAMVNLGQLLYVLGDFSESRALHREAVELQLSSLGRDHPNRSVTLSNLAVLHRQFGEHEEARATVEEALAIGERRFGPDDHRLAPHLSTLALILSESGRDDEALPLARRLLRIQEVQNGPEHVVVIPTHTLLGQILDQQGSAEAGDHHRRAADIAARVAAGDVETGTAWREYGRYQRRRGDRAGAARSLDRAIATFTAAGLEDHPRYAAALVERAALRLDTGDAAGALADAVAAESLAQRHFRHTVRSLPEQVALDYAAARPRGLGLAVAALTALPRNDDASIAVLDALVRSRALVLDEMAQRHRHVRATGDSVTRAAAERLAVARARAAGLYVAWSRSGDAGMHKAYAAAESTAQALEDDALAAAGGRARGEDPGLAAVRAVLVPGDALVSFVRYARDSVIAYAGFVAAHGRDGVAFVPLGDAAALERACTAWLEEVSRDPRATGASAAAAERASRTRGERVRRMAWDPLAPHLAGARRILVVPDGALSFVPFAALPDTSGGYLIERGPLVHYLSAERDLVRDGDPAAARGLLALGGPDFDARPAGPVLAATDAGATATAAYRGPLGACRELQAMRFESLPGTRAEVRDVAAIWDRTRGPAGDALVHLGSDASETAFKREAPGRRVLHLATHAFVVGGTCVEKAEGTRAMGLLVDASRPATVPPASAAAPPPRTPPPPATTRTRENPLQLVGLALAGANARDDAGPDAEDGVLTAEEVASLDLADCEWAVLSSCHSGIGEYAPAEGLLGLRRAFAVAGARTLIASLWAVGDESTRVWMSQLYRARFERGEATEAATRTAALAVLEERRAARRSTHPFHWAAFVAVGTPDRD